MSKYRFGKEALQRFVDRNMVILQTADGYQVPIFKRKRNAGGRGLNMWAFAVPKPQPRPEPVIVEPLPEIEVRDVEAPEPGTPNDEETREADRELDSGTGGGFEEAVGGQD